MLRYQPAGDRASYRISAGLFGAKREKLTEMQRPKAEESEAKEVVQ
jgi:hypothetical protein